MKTEPIMNKEKLAGVEWLDAQTGFSQCMPLSEFKEDFEPLITHSFGYLLESNKEYIILGFMVMKSQHGEPQIKHWQLIPRGMIKDIKYYKPQGEKLK